MAISESPQSKAMGSPSPAPESLHHHHSALRRRLRLLPPSTTTLSSSSKFLQQHDSAALLIPILSSCYLKPRPSGCGGVRASVSPPVMRVRALFSTGPSPSSSSSSRSPEVQNFKLPPPVNPPDPENPDRATLRAQWDHAVRLYGRMYSHAWGTAIMAGVSLFGIGWWIKGENPLKALSPTGELNKKEENAD